MTSLCVSVWDTRVVGFPEAGEFVGWFRKKMTRPLAFLIRTNGLLKPALKPVPVERIQIAIPSCALDSQVHVMPPNGATEVGPARSYSEAGYRANERDFSP